MKIKVSRVRGLDRVEMDLQGAFPMASVYPAAVRVAAVRCMRVSAVVRAAATAARALASSVNEEHEAAVSALLRKPQEAPCR